MTMMNPSVHEAFEKLKQVRDQTLKSMLQFQFEVAIGLRSQIQKNILDTFGSDKPDRSPITRMSIGGTARTSGRGGALFNSVIIEQSGKNLAVSIGGVGVPYANIHEYGGTIFPKNARFLTIPLSSDYRGRRAREFDLIVERDPTWGLVLATRDGKLAYALRRKATIPARPYVQPAINKIQEIPSVKAMLLASFKSLKAEVIIE